MLNKLALYRSRSDPSHIMLLPYLYSITEYSRDCVCGKVKDMDLDMYFVSYTTEYTPRCLATSKRFHDERRTTK